MRPWRGIEPGRRPYHTPLARWFAPVCRRLGVREGVRLWLDVPTCGSRTNRRRVRVPVGSQRTVRAVAGRGDRVSLDLREAGEYDSLVKVYGKQVLSVSQFLKLRERGTVLVHAKGVNLAKTCETNCIPYHVVKGLYVQVGASLVSSSRNCVAVKRTQLARLRKAIGKWRVPAASTRAASNR